MLICELRNLFLDTAKFKFGHPILHQGNFLIFYLNKNEMWWLFQKQGVHVCIFLYFNCACILPLYTLYWNSL